MAAPSRAPASMGARPLAGVGWRRPQGHRDLRGRFTLVVVVATIGLLASEHVPRPVAILGSVVVLLLVGVIEDGQAFSGFADPAPISVAALYCCLPQRRRPGSWSASRRAYSARPPGRSSATGAPLSGSRFRPRPHRRFSTTPPIVAIVAPGVLAWTRRTGRAASRFLMPVSFAAILGRAEGLVSRRGSQRGRPQRDRRRPHGDSDGLAAGAGLTSSGVESTA